MVKRTSRLSTRIRVSGCYAFQVDGVGFSHVLAFGVQQGGRDRDVIERPRDRSAGREYEIQAGDRPFGRTEPWRRRMQARALSVGAWVAWGCGAWLVARSLLPHEPDDHPQHVPAFWGAGIIPFLACWKLKAWLGYDDALDTFGVHGVGGTLGALLTGILADPNVNAVVGGVKEGLVGSQIKAILVTMVLSIVGTTIIAFIVKAVIGLRPSEEVEVTGLDLSEHGEEGYHQARG